MEKLRQIISKLYNGERPTRDEFLYLASSRRTATQEVREWMYGLAREKATGVYGNAIFLRGLIEFTNYCRNNCYYCGLRRDNREVHRYRLTKDDILACAEQGYALNFRTIVLQGGEDLAYSDEDICDIVRGIKEQHPDCAVTLSIGEKSRESYQKYFDAGADRYLLRHETANAAHYRHLHPSELSMENRQRCLRDLREIGYQIGAGFMVGSPGQTDECYADDLEYLWDLQPHMIGIGPFIPHHETPFRAEAAGTLEDTLYFLAVLRLMFPEVLLPATTALGTIHPKGREMGVLAGANVIMPNLSPVTVRKDYLLYDGKICTGDEAAECRYCMERRMAGIGYRVVTDRGDHKRFAGNKEPKGNKEPEGNKEPKGNKEPGGKDNYV